MSNPRIIRKPDEMLKWSKEAVKSDFSIGFVPTMGALHVGHRRIIERACEENDVTVVSVFVNPTQFGPGEDYEMYPRDLDTDVEMCADVDVDCVFAPEIGDMYNPDKRTWIEVGGLTNNLCGLSRPGHFRGVCTVVSKLLSIVRPDRAYFGRKDAQQLRIIEVMVRDLNLGCEVVPCDTVREPDGLAVSSRNKYLSPTERRQAVTLYESLQHCRNRVDQGERDAVMLLKEMTEFIDEEPDTEIDYIALVDAATLEDLEKLSGDVLIALAVKVGETRLIDNIRLTVEPDPTPALRP